MDRAARRWYRGVNAFYAPTALKDLSATPCREMRVGGLCSPQTGISSVTSTSWQKRESFMRNHHIVLLLWLALCLWPGVPVHAMGSPDAGNAERTDSAPRNAGATASASAQTPAPQNPSVHNEYNNSTVYNGDVYNSTNDSAGYNGFAGTWRDPETGDIITSVIAPRQPQPEQNTPVIVAPQIYPGENRPYPPGPGPYPPYPPGPPPRPHPNPGPHPGPWPHPAPPRPSPVPPWQQPGWQGTTPPQGHMPPGWRPPSNTRPWPHAPGYLPAPRNNIAPSTGLGGTGGTGGLGGAGLPGRGAGGR